MYPYVFVSVLGFYEMGRHKLSIIFKGSTIISIYIIYILAVFTALSLSLFQGPMSKGLSLRKSLNYINISKTYFSLKKSVHLSIQTYK